MIKPYDLIPLLRQEKGDLAIRFSGSTQAVEICFHYSEQHLESCKNHDFAVYYIGALEVEPSL